LRIAAVFADEKLALLVPARRQDQDPHWAMNPFAFMVLGVAGWMNRNQ
jgi:hypothetical protein